YRASRIGTCAISWNEKRHPDGAQVVWKAYARTLVVELMTFRVTPLRPLRSPSLSLLVGSTRTLERNCPQERSCAGSFALRLRKWARSSVGRAVRDSCKRHHVRLQRCSAPAN